jgi:hypothetical protein
VFNFQLPPQKGQELFPNTLGVTPSVRVMGVNLRTAEGALALRRAMPKARNIYDRELHDFSLSSLDYQSRRVMLGENEWIDIAFVAGQQLITLRLNPVIVPVEPEPEDTPLDVEEVPPRGSLLCRAINTQLNQYWPTNNLNWWHVIDYSEEHGFRTVYDTYTNLQAVLSIPPVIPLAGVLCQGGVLYHSGQGRFYLNATQVVDMTAAGGLMSGTTDGVEDFICVGEYLVVMQRVQQSGTAAGIGTGSAGGLHVFSFKYTGTLNEDYVSHYKRTPPLLPYYNGNATGGGDTPTGSERRSEWLSGSFSPSERKYVGVSADMVYEVTLGLDPDDDSLIVNVSTSANDTKSIIRDLFYESDEYMVAEQEPNTSHGSDPGPPATIAEPTITRDAQLPWVRRERMLLPDVTYRAGVKWSGDNYDLVFGRTVVQFNGSVIGELYKERTNTAEIVEPNSIVKTGGTIFVGHNREHARTVFSSTELSGGVAAALKEVTASRNFTQTSTSVFLPPAAPAPTASFTRRDLLGLAPYGIQEINVGTPTVSNFPGDYVGPLVSDSAYTIITTSSYFPIDSVLPDSPYGPVRPAGYPYSAVRRVVSHNTPWAYQLATGVQMNINLEAFIVRHGAHYVRYPEGGFVYSYTGFDPSIGGNVGVFSVFGESNPANIFPSSYTFPAARRLRLLNMCAVIVPTDFTWP